MINSKSLKTLFSEHKQVLQKNLLQLDEKLRTNIFRYNPSSLITGKFFIYECKDGFVVISRPLQDRNQEPELKNVSKQTIEEFYTTINDEVRKYYHVGLGVYTNGYIIERINFPKQEFQMRWINQPPFRTLTPCVSHLWFITHGCEMQSIEEIVDIDIKDAIASVNLETKSNANSIAKEFLKLIDNNPLEEDVQKYLNDHSYIIEPAFINKTIKPKISDLFVADYGFEIREHNAVDWLFVEIERPNKPIFTKNDQFTSHYTQAKGQLLHWKQHLLKNISYFSNNNFRGIERPKFILIYGRNSELNETRRGLLKGDWDQSDMIFTTYDDLLERFTSTIINLNFNSQQTENID